MRHRLLCNARLAITFSPVLLRIFPSDGYVLCRAIRNKNPELRGLVFRAMLRRECCNANTVDVTYEYGRYVKLEPFHLHVFVRTDRRR